MKNRVNAINVGNTKRAKYFLYVFCINLPPYGYKCFLRKTEEEAADDRLLPLRILSNDARVKSLKPRCACTGVVLWLNDPPRYEHKSGALASRYANIG